MFKFNHVLYNIKLKEKGLSNTELIKRLGIKFATLGTWKRGENYPSGENLQNFCRLLEVEADEIFIKPDKEVDGEKVTSDIRLNEPMLNRMSLQHELLGTAFSLSGLNLELATNTEMSPEKARFLQEKTEEFFSLVWECLEEEVKKNMQQF